MGFRVNALDDTSTCRGLQIVRLSTGAFDWTSAAVGLGPMRLYRGWASAAALITGTTPRGYVTLILPKSADSSVEFWGEPLDLPRFGCAQPGSPFHTVLAGESEFLLIELPASLTEALPTDPIHEVIGPSNRHPTIETGRGACLISALNDLVDPYRIQTDLSPDGSGGSQAESEVLECLTALLAHSRPVEIARSRAARQQVLNRALKVISCQSAPMSLQDLASASGVSPRTLQRIFHATLRLSPQRYERRWRLHGFRRELVSASRHTATVTAIAAQWGFVQMGRLAGEYRELFGELPRVTLMRNQNQSYGRGNRAVGVQAIPVGSGGW